jgi:hypothetical protein
VSRRYGRSLFVAAGYETCERVSGLVIRILVVEVSRSPPVAAFGSFGEGVTGRDTGRRLARDVVPVTPVIGEVDSTLGCVVDLLTGVQLVRGWSSSG